MVYNFNPGPAVVPAAALREAAANLVDFRGQGMSIVEMSHRGQVYEEIHQQAIDRCLRLYGLGPEFTVLLLQGGASLQFAMVPMNLLRPGQSADYISTGHWSQKAVEEVGLVGRTCRLAGSSEAADFSYIPAQAELDLDAQAAYLHLTTNNTIYGTQFQALPRSGGVPIVADMSSDLLSRPLPWDGIGLAYGGAQKNAGIAGLTVVIARREWLDRASVEGVPTVMRYATHTKSNSLYNTPPVFAIYLFGLVLQWIEAEGGLAGIDARNQHKAGLVYAAIDASAGFYRGHARPDSRSLMNLTFKLPDAALDARFCSQAEKAGLIGLKGHRSVGGVRASLYNALDPAGCQALAEFMRDFARQHA
ncbi:MAG: 3-phosphoserine/phosphohydroxythreonine transaminase [Candidatus Latescibacteria bacterium]|nr:3-phosphoserine/phosphohydroxythreonine transaminase [Candidatus Latescibacterota bacterium]